MKIHTKQSVLQKITQEVQYLLDNYRSIDYIEVTNEELEELKQEKEYSDVSGLSISVKNPQGNSVPKLFRVKLEFNLKDLSYQKLIQYAKSNYPDRIKLKGISHDALLEELTKIESKNEEFIQRIDTNKGSDIKSR